MDSTALSMADRSPIRPLAPPARRWLARAALALLSSSLAFSPIFAQVTEEPIGEETLGSGELEDVTPPTGLGTGVEEEDLVDSGLVDGSPSLGVEPSGEDEPGLPVLADEVVVTLFSEAEATYRSIDRPASLSQLSQLIDLFENHLDESSTLAELRAAEAEAEQAGQQPSDVDAMGPEGAGAPSEDAEDGGNAEAEDEAEAEPPPPPPVVTFLDAAQRGIFARTLGLRAVLYDELGEKELADFDLERMLQVDPDADLAGAEPPQGLGGRFERLRKQKIGELAFAIEPPDAVVRIEGRRTSAGPGELTATFAGEVTVVVERPGYRTAVETLDVRAGRQRTLEMTLEREAAVLRLTTRPNGATVRIDGAVVGTTQGMASADDLPATGAYRSEEFSDELVIDPVPLGLRVLEVAREGYRTYRVELMIDDLLDYPIPPIVLQDERGVLVFRNLPPDSQVRIDGREHVLENPGSSLPRLTLAPGEYEVSVASGRAKMFSTRLFLADQQTLDVRVKLRPGVSYLGLVGADAETARDFDRALRRVFDDASAWALLDRSADGVKVLEEAGADQDALVAALDRGTLDDLDWQQIQWSADQRAPGAIYVAGLLSETLVERRVRLLVWSAAPGPARPEVLDMPPGDTSAFEALRRRFDHDIPLRRAWTGALVMDTLASPHPVVASVTPGSAAEAAGLRVGDAVVAVSRVPIFSRSDFDRRIATAELGEVIELGVQGSEGARTLRFEVRPGPASLPLDDPDLLPAVAFTRLLQLAEEVAPRDRWLVQLDQALILVRSRQWEDAVRLLRTLDAPQTSHGFGKAAVDYWLGFALSHLGSDYREAARQAFERAARLTEARLGHNDGPWLAPRARARLYLLGTGGDS